MSQTFLNAVDNDKTWQQKLRSKGKPTKVDIPRGYGKKMIEDRWKIILKSNEKYKQQLEEQQDVMSDMKKSAKDELLDADTDARSDLFKDNIENFIGTVKVPVGIAGPIRVNGLHAQGDYFVPLATTEAALVASINRGISVLNQSGGVTAVVLEEGVNRDPCFCFKDIVEMGQFYSWSLKQFEQYKKVAEGTTRHGKLIRVEHIIEGN
jgi:hydroxymethylglutaryl-CoA reductase (NADPH)